MEIIQDSGLFHKLFCSDGRLKNWKIEIEKKSACIDRI